MKLSVDVKFFDSGIKYQCLAATVVDVNYLVNVTLTTWVEEHIVYFCSMHFNLAILCSLLKIK